MIDREKFLKFTDHPHLLRRLEERGIEREKVTEVVKKGKPTPLLKNKVSFVHGRYKVVACLRREQIITVYKLAYMTRQKRNKLFGKGIPKDQKSAMELRLKTRKKKKKRGSRGN